MSHILIGIGGTGGKILKAFRQRLWNEYTEEERKHLPIGFIYVDTDRSMLNPTDPSYQTIHGNCCFTASDFVDIKTNSNIDDIFNNPKGFTRLMGVLGNVSETQTATCPVGAAADQKRRAGRLLFGANIDAYLHKLRTELTEMNKREMGQPVNIHIFCGLAGGTGSGAIIDAVVQTRKLMFDQTKAEGTGFNLTVFCQLPETQPNPSWDNGRYHANGYGALLELNNLFTSHHNQAWAGKGAVPPYDITSNVEKGRAYLSFDNPTAENVKAGAIPQQLKIANGMMLYSSTNSFGFTITDPEELARMVSDFIYTYIFCPGGPIDNEFRRFYTYENLANSRDEYDETADPADGAPVPVRTRAIGSFGIKRVMVPEQEISEHITYTLGTAAMLQLKYDNWSSAAGFRDEPKNFDPLGYLAQPGRQDSWNLDRKHLMLKEYILPGDSKEGWRKGEFSSYWGPCVSNWATAAKGADQPFDQLVNLCRGGFESGFRNKGVENFYTDKASALDSYVRQIAETVEKYIFKEWTEGRLSISEARKVVDRLVVYIGNEALSLQEKLLPELAQKCDALMKDIQLTKNEYLAAGMLKRPIIFGNRFQRVTGNCEQLYCLKTEMEAVRLFAVPLAQALENAFNDLAHRLVGFEQAIDDVIKFNKERMTNLLPDLYETTDDGLADLTDPVVDFYHRGRLKDLEERLCGNEGKMDKICKTMRGAITEQLASDGRFLNVGAFNRSSISHILLDNVYPEILAFHNELCSEESKRVLQVPIMERLMNKYRGKTEELNEFARQLITASGVFTEINMNEIRLNNANTDAPQIGTNILITRILVILPKVKSPELVSFASDLESALRGAIPGGTGASITVSTDGKEADEITISIIENNFPMRAINSVPMLKAKFDQLVAANPSNAIVLVSEGRAQDYRPLFAVPAKKPDEIRDDVMPYMLLDLGLGRILLDEGTSGQYGASSGLDILGNATITPWGHTKFIDMPFDDALIESRAREIKRLYRDAMEEEFKEIDPTALLDIKTKLDELQKSVVANVSAVIKAENPTPKPRYQQFVNWLTRGIEILKSYKPE